MSEAASNLTPARPYRYWSLDIWRGLACLLVVVYHSGFYVFKNPATVYGDPMSRAAFAVISRCWLGVPLFFVISGYCITAACEALRRQRGSLGAYFIRRFRRIFPPYLIMLTGALAVYGALAWAGHAGFYQDGVNSIINPLALSGWEWLGNVTLTETWRATLAGAPYIQHTFFMAHGWTLAYEEQFYAVCGLALFFQARRFKWAMLAVSVLVAGVFVFSLFHPLRIEGFFFDGRWLVFAAGALVFYRLHGVGVRGGRLLNMLVITAAIATLALQGRGPASLIWHEIRVGCWFAVALLALHRWDWPLITSRAARPLALCGTMCYSLYLIHWPIVKLLSKGMYVLGVRGPWPTLLVTIPVCVAASAAAGWAFHLAVERRFLNSPASLPAVRGGEAPCSQGCGPAQG